MRTAVSRRSGRRCASLVTPLLGFELTVCAVLIHALRSGAPRDKLSSVGTAAPHRRLSLEGVPQSAFPGTAANGPCWGLRRFWGSSRSRHRAAGLRPMAANTRRRARTSYWTRSLPLRRMAPTGASAVSRFDHVARMRHPYSYAIPWASRCPQGSAAPSR